MELHTYTSVRTLRRTKLQATFESNWLSLLITVLLGYFLIGRGFAYTFVGEMTMVLGIAIFLRSHRLLIPFENLTIVLYLLFAVLGFARTVPFFSEYGINALRDAFLWIYGIFALLVSSAIKLTDLQRFLMGMRRFAFWGMPAAFLLFMVGRLGDNAGLIPRVPWAPDVSILGTRMGDASVFVSAFITLSLLFPTRGRSIEKSIVREGLPSFALMLLTLFCVASGRAGIVNIIIPSALCMLFRPTVVAPKLLVATIVCGLIAAAVFSSGKLQATDIRGRSFNAQQIVENATSIFSSDTRGDLQDNKEWRLHWWNSIVQATMFGPQFWTGYGFGVNLTLLPGAPGQDEALAGLRSPHNATMNILARMGVPGLLLWLLLLACFGYRVMHAQFLATRLGSRFWANVFLWIFCVWLASLINSFTDVYLEGPTGGIFFWSLIGMGEGSVRLFAEWQKEKIHIVPVLARTQAERAR